MVVCIVRRGFERRDSFLDHAGCKTCMNLMIPDEVLKHLWHAHFQIFQWVSTHFYTQQCKPHEKEILKRNYRFHVCSLQIFLFLDKVKLFCISWKEINFQRKITSCLIMKFLTRFLTDIIDVSVILLMTWKYIHRCITV